ncbi:hypothetical protein [Klebsiella aerogenes]|uniref:hypothetical protein n=1 Tax=Klebsiella aerogenes TaxID=548 RepID=UPI003896CAA8
MKERGMIFNGEMVRAILDGRKTQTRRIIAPQPADDIERGIFPNPEAIGWKSSLRHKHGSTTAHFCHYGKPGDRIWVRETFACLGNEDGCAIDWNDNLVKGGGPDAARIYRASCEQKPGNYGLWSIPDDASWKPHTDEMQFEGVWVPSIHMPRWASRILLEITDVRVERLNAISEEDAMREGIDADRLSESQDNYDCIADHNMTGRPTAKGYFSELWQSIYGEESWKANPWVWVIEFKRIEERAA